MRRGHALSPVRARGRSNVGEVMKVTRLEYAYRWESCVATHCYTSLLMCCMKDHEEDMHFEHNVEKHGNKQQTGSIFSFSSAGGDPPRADAARAATPVPPQPPPPSPRSPPPPTLVSALLAPALMSRSAGAAASLCIVGIFACGLEWWHAPVTAEPLPREALREDMSNASATTEFCAASCGTVAIHTAVSLGLLDERVLCMPHSTMATMESCLQAAAAR